MQTVYYMGHEKMIQMRKDAEADINAQGEDYWLQAASLEGHEKMVQMPMVAGQVHGQMPLP